MMLKNSLEFFLSLTCFVIFSSNCSPNKRFEVFSWIISLFSNIFRHPDIFHLFFITHYYHQGICKSIIRHLLDCHPQFEKFVRGQHFSDPPGNPMSVTQVQKFYHFFFFFFFFFFALSRKPVLSPLILILVTSKVEVSFSFWLVILERKIRKTHLRFIS